MWNKDMHQLEKHDMHLYTKKKRLLSVYFTDNSRPLLICEHSLDAPARAEYVERLGETVIVNEAGVDREKPHHQDDVASAEERRPYLRPADTQLSAKANPLLDSGFCITDERSNSFPPHYWIFSSSAFFPSAPSTRQRDSLPTRGRGRQTSQRTERGTWWWCRELPARETHSACSVITSPELHLTKRRTQFVLCKTQWEFLPGLTSR